MAVDRSLWGPSFTGGVVPALPCPRCAKGRLRLNPGHLTVLEPTHSIRQHSEDDFEPDWIIEAFTALLTCDHAVCGEVVSISGHASTQYFIDYQDDGQDEGTYTRVLYPSSMHPAPPLFRVSKKIPADVLKELRLAFQLFWMDISAAASRVRTSLELLLDEQGISRKGIDKQQKPYRLNLQQRIDLFEVAASDADSAESMKALRIVGNLGTHGDEVTRNDFFDLIDVYEDALLEIYEKKSLILKAKKLSLIQLSKP